MNPRDILIKKYREVAMALGDLNFKYETQSAALRAELKRLNEIGNLFPAPEQGKIDEDIKKSDS